MPDRPLFYRPYRNDGILDTYAPDVGSGSMWGPIKFSSNVFPGLIGGSRDPDLGDEIYVGFGDDLPTAGSVDRFVRQTTEAVLRDARDLTASWEERFRFLHLAPYPLPNGWELVSFQEDPESGRAHLILGHPASEGLLVIDKEEGGAIGLTTAGPTSSMRLRMGAEGTLPATEWYNARKTERELALLSGSSRFESDLHAALAFSAFFYASGQYPADELGAVNLRFRPSYYDAVYWPKSVLIPWDGTQFEVPAQLTRMLPHLSRKPFIVEILGSNERTRRVNPSVPERPLASIEFSGGETYSLRINNPNPDSLMPLSSPLQRLGTFGGRDVKGTGPLERAAPLPVRLSRPNALSASSGVALPSPSRVSPSPAPLGLPSAVEVKNDLKATFRVGDKDVPIRFSRPGFLALVVAMLRYPQRDGADWGISPQALEGMLSDPRLRLDHPQRAPLATLLAQIGLILNKKVGPSETLFSIKYRGGPRGAAGIWREVSLRVNDEAGLIKEALESLTQWDRFLRRSKEVKEAENDLVIGWIESEGGHHRILVVPNPRQQTLAHVSPVIPTPHLTTFAERMDTHKLLFHRSVQRMVADRRLHHHADLVEGRKWLRVSQGRHELISPGTLSFTVNPALSGFQCLETMAIL